jgi:predicted O-linked N-acetylglucosamine transferase (SPINDLY family)
MAKSVSQKRPAKIDPGLFDEAVAHHTAGRLKEAERLYRRIATAQPPHAESWSNLGLILSGRGAYAEAASACRRAIEIQPDYLQAYLNLIGALEGLRAYDEAADVYRKVIPMAPKRADLWNNFGIVLDAQGRAAQAVLAFREAISAKPDYVAAYFNLARALAPMGWTQEAIKIYQQLLALDPNHAAAWSNLGTLLGGVGHFDAGAVASQRAAALAPDNAEILCNLGVLLHRQGRVNEAVENYRKALAIRADYAAALGNLAAGLQEQFKFDEAASVLKQAIEVKPDFDTAIVELIKIRRHICDWSEYSQDERKLIDYIAQKKDLIFMLLLMGFSSTPAQQLACARLAMKRLNESTARIGPHPEAATSGRLKIGYLSADYRDHPVGRLLPDLFALHDRGKVEVIAYSLGTEDNGALHGRIRAACDGFVDLHHLSNHDAAARIYADKIDILIDLTGPTIGSRSDILALRPAPIQVSFLGWPGSMGADFIDYVIADPFVVPREQQKFYNEKIVHLPDCYQPSDLHRPVPDMPSRAECGLPEKGFVFCSFNNPNKITPKMFDVWMRLLKKVDNSVLWLYCKSEQTKENLNRRREAHRLGADRIVFTSVMRYETYLGRLRCADLFLDSFPYNAGATCNDALWVGVPVLTCAGDTYVSRMAGSLLTAAGLPELITHSLADYEAQAIRLASEPKRLAKLRKRLVETRDGMPLYDMTRFTKALEQAYTQMQEIRAAGEAPRFFAVDRV